MNLLDLDARWKRLHDPDRSCPCCDRQFDGVFDIGFDEPDDWPHAARSGAEDVIVGDDRLGAELCRTDGRHFIRAVLQLPIRGSDEVFNFGLWLEVGLDSFRSYADSLEQGATCPDGEGLLANPLPGFEDAQGSAMHFTCPDPAQRPLVVPPEDGADEALMQAQKHGISFDELLDIYAAAGNDIRPHLAA